jgi:hypothetical protein
MASTEPDAAVWVHSSRFTPSSSRIKLVDLGRHDHTLAFALTPAKVLAVSALPRGDSQLLVWHNLLLHGDSGIVARRLVRAESYLEMRVADSKFLTETMISR